MKNRIDKLIKTLFYILFFFTPLIVIPINSELFEFGKMVFVYLVAILITFSWITKSILLKKIIFKKNLLEIPIIIHFFSQGISTFTSIDPITSIFGYYSRFNGSLLSTISYTILFFAFVSIMDKKSALKSLYFLVASSLPVPLYGILQHFGIDKNIWVQDVQNRVFSTFGQPNWLAAWVAAIIPVTMFMFMTRNKLWYALLILQYLTLLFTKSRSGIIAFGVTYLLFFTTTLIFNFRKYKKDFLLVTLGLFSLTILIGTPWTINLSDLITGGNLRRDFKDVSIIHKETSNEFVPALEMGGTESGDIRKIVWKGAFNVWKAHPIFGTGVETFAYSFYAYRPVEHNLTSEWDYLYNKAHNEFLNYAANTGSLGLLSYLVLITFCIIIFLKPRDTINIALLSGFLSVQITNFFGFSVVNISLATFIFPAISLVIHADKNSSNIAVKKEKNIYKTNTTTKCAVILIIFSFGYLLLNLYNYWYADILFTKGEVLYKKEDYYGAKDYFQKAIRLSPHQATYFDHLAQSLASIAVSELDKKNNSYVEETAESAINTIEKAISISSGNFHLLKSKASLYIKLAELDNNLLKSATDILNKIIDKSPSDAKMYYNLGLLYERLGNHQKAIAEMEKTVTLKPNYKEGRYALAILYKRSGEVEKAKGELRYILKYISPKDTDSQNMLDNL